MISRPTLLLTALASLYLVALLPAQTPPYPQPLPSPEPLPSPQGTVPVYRVLNPQTGEHRFSDDAGEVHGYVSSVGFRNEGVRFGLLTNEGPDLTPLYRLALPNGSTALGIMTVPGYKDPRGPVDKTLGLLSIRAQPGWVSLYEWYNPHLGLWFYTTDQRGEGAAGQGYRYQRIVGYVLPAS
jgi:hypothetical protein